MRIAWLVVGLGAIAAIAYFGRYQMAPVLNETEAAVFVLDRWTGVVWACPRPDARQPGPACVRFFPRPNSN